MQYAAVRVYYCVYVHINVHVHACPRVGMWTLDSCLGRPKVNVSSRKAAGVLTDALCWLAEQWKGRAPLFKCGDNPDHLGHLLSNKRAETRRTPPLRDLQRGLVYSPPLYQFLVFL